jgi:hypothetical protein
MADRVGLLIYCEIRVLGFVGDKSEQDFCFLVKFFFEFILFLSRSFNLYVCWVRCNALALWVGRQWQIGLICCVC